MAEAPAVLDQALYDPSHVGSRRVDHGIFHEVHVVVSSHAQHPAEVHAVLGGVRSAQDPVVTRLKVWMSNIEALPRVVLDEQLFSLDIILQQLQYPRSQPTLNLIKAALLPAEVLPLIGLEHLGKELALTLLVFLHHHEGVVLEMLALRLYVLTPGNHELFRMHLLRHVAGDCEGLCVVGLVLAVVRRQLTILGVRRILLVLAPGESGDVKLFPASNYLLQGGLLVLLLSLPEEAAGL